MQRRKRYGITPDPPDVKPEGKYTTTEAAAKLDTHRNSITNWFNQGLLRPIDPTAERLRYRGRELTRFWNWKTANG